MSDRVGSCSHTLSYSERWEVYYCVPCDEWAEDPCDPDTGCEFCEFRPDRPSEDHP